MAMVIEKERKKNKEAEISSTTLKPLAREAEDTHTHTHWNCITMRSQLVSSSRLVSWLAG